MAATFTAELTTEDVRDYARQHLSAAELLALACDAFAADELDTCDADDLALRQQTLARGVDRLQSEAVRNVEAATARDVFAHHGAANAKQWVGWTSRCNGGAASDLVTMAKQRSNMPEATAAFEAGEISVGHYRQFARCAATNTEAYQAHESDIVAWANDADCFGELTHAVNEWVAFHDPAAMLRLVEEQRPHRSFRLAKAYNGMLEGNFRLDEVEGAIVEAWLRDATPPPTETDTRTLYQRQADAFVALCSGKQPAQITLVADVSVLDDPGGPGRCELGRRKVVHPETLRRYFCDADVRYYLFDEYKMPLGVTAPAKTTPKRLREAILLRDGGCIWPGCDRSPADCDVHHLHHRSAGGTHDPANLGTACRRHHRMLHEGGWTATLVNAAGEKPRLVVTPPPGHTVPDFRAPPDPWPDGPLPDCGNPFAPVPDGSWAMPEGVRLFSL